MIPLDVTIDITGYVENVEEARSKDIPFAAAATLTRCAQDAQTEVRRGLAQKFKLRNTWTMQGIRITPAQKLSWPIQAEVYTATANDQTGAPDYLVRQEDGGEKVPVNGRHHIAIPTKYLRQYAPTVIPEDLRPRSLLPADAEVGKVYAGRFKSIGQGRGKGISKRGLKAFGSSEFAAFIQVTRRGSLCIFVRSSASKRDAEPWYLLVPSADVRAVLEMQETVDTVAQARFEQHWDDVWDGIRGG